MDRKIAKTLLDIKNSIDEIDMFFERRPRRFDDFCEDLLLRRAIQMNISIIGEATNRILKEVPDINISHARQIVNTRNYIIHGYDSLSLEMLWAIVIKDIPILKSEVEALLEGIE
jgi:uncharacterized protein with HEPN domain